MLLLVACMAPMFAGKIEASGIGGDNKIDLSFVVNIVNFIVGGVAGGLVLVKSGVDMFQAFRNQDQDPHGVKKVLMNLVLNVVFLGGFLVMVNVIFKGYITGGTGGAAATATNTNAAFFSGLQGAVANIIPF